MKGVNMYFLQIGIFRYHIAYMLKKLLDIRYPAFRSAGYHDGRISSKISTDTVPVHPPKNVYKYIMWYVLDPTKP